MTTWAMEEYAGAKLGDGRLNVRLFNVLKNGCRVEALQLGSVGKIELSLAVFMVVSWRLARLVRLGRTHPDLAATTIFTDEELKGTYILAKKPIPKTTPTLREVIRRIAMLGGFLARKVTANPASRRFGLAFSVSGILWKGPSICGNQCYMSCV